VHTAAHVAEVRRRVPQHGLFHFDGDTPAGPHSLDAALYAAGAVIAAVDLVLAGRTAAAFCNVRPPGHHATPSRAMGFCLFDNVAVGAAHALAAHGLERVAIADFAVHHGNGTEDAFAGHAQVLFCSSFQEGIYPYPDPAAARNVVKVPLSPDAGPEQLRERIARAFAERLRAFAPQLLLLSAGFDAHRADPIGGLCLRDEDYEWLTRRLVDAVAGSARGVVSVLEGGYDLDALAGSAAAHVRGLVPPARRDG
jgi:acetoin utilization deacetylase AcuC-like enzyme